MEDSCVVALGEEAKAFEALPVLPGGPPWLLLGETERPGQGADEPPQPEQTSSPPTDGPGQPTETALRELQDARAAAELYAERVAQLEARLAEQQREAKALKAALRKATAERRNRTLPEVFADDEEQFRWEVDFAYLVRVDEVQRAEYPLADFVVGPAFLNRMDSLQGISRDKILDVVVDVLSDRAKDIATREVHQWLEHRAGGQEVRHDGARAWRASLQVRSNSARRLKYWRLPDGRIELDSVGVHDDGIR